MTRIWRFTSCQQPGAILSPLRRNFIKRHRRGRRCRHPRPNASPGSCRIGVKGKTRPWKNSSLSSIRSCAVWLGGTCSESDLVVNEAYLRLVNSRQVNWQNRAHFFAISAQLMRRILVDYARARGYLKRGGGVPKVTLDEALMGPQEKGHDLVALDDALNALVGVDPRKSKVVELRFFGGLSVEETAEVLKVSPDTVLRDWRLAKAWLTREMGKSVAHGNDA